MVVAVGTTAEGIINVDYEVIVEVLIEVYFEVITRRYTMSIRSYSALLTLPLKSSTPLY